jgi:hypothetical protein
MASGLFPDEIVNDACIEFIRDRTYDNHYRRKRGNLPGAYKRTNERRLCMWCLWSSDIIAITLDTVRRCLAAVVVTAQLAVLISERVETPRTMWQIHGLRHWANKLPPFLAARTVCGAISCSIKAAAGGVPYQPCEPKSVMADPSSANSQSDRLCVKLSGVLRNINEESLFDTHSDDGGALLLWRAVSQCGSRHRFAPGHAVNGSSAVPPAHAEFILRSH